MSFINTFQDSRDFILLTFYNQGRLDILYCCSFNLMNLFEREREKNRNGGRKVERLQSSLLSNQNYVQ